MSAINPTSPLQPYEPLVGDLNPGPADGADVNSFEQYATSGGDPSEQELQDQFDKNFQTLSYLFMKGVFSYAEEEIRRRQ